MVKKSYTYLNTLKNYYIIKGRRNTVEDVFWNFNFYMKYMKYLKTSKKVKRRLTFNVLLFMSRMNTTPNIRLKLKKRRKYTIYRIFPGQKSWGLRKGLNSFSKAFKNQKQKSKDFFNNFYKFLFYVQAGKSALQNVRDTNHKLAKRWSPKLWKRKAWKEKQAKKEDLIYKKYDEVFAGLDQKNESITKKKNIKNSIKKPIRRSTKKLVKRSQQKRIIMKKKLLKLKKYRWSKQRYKKKLYAKNPKYREWEKFFRINKEK